jgi:hypothetical protein
LKKRIEEFNVIFHPDHYISKVGKLEKLDLIGLKSAGLASVSIPATESSINITTPQTVDVTTSIQNVEQSNVILKEDTPTDVDNRNIKIIPVSDSVLSSTTSYISKQFSSTFSFFFFKYFSVSCLIPRVLLSESDALYSGLFLSFN